MCTSDGTIVYTNSQHSSKLCTNTCGLVQIDPSLAFAESPVPLWPKTSLKHRGLHRMLCTQIQFVSNSHVL